MKHRKCGGELYEDWGHASIVPMSVGRDIIATTQPRLMCRKCGIEILDDADIVVKARRAEARKLFHVLVQCGLE